MGDSGAHLALRGQEDSNGDYEDEDDDPSTPPDEDDDDTMLSSSTVPVLEGTRNCGSPEMQELLHMGDSGTHLASRGQRDNNENDEDEDDDPSTAPTTTTTQCRCRQQLLYLKEPAIAGLPRCRSCCMMGDSSAHLRVALCTRRADPGSMRRKKFAMHMALYIHVSRSHKTGSISSMHPIL